MSGHSKWATTKRAKAIVDAKRGAVFTKMANIITLAAKEKGGNPEMNFSLRMAIDKAKAANMPKENIERAVKRGTGEIQGAAIEELYYEGIGPANSQFIVKCLTDSKNRTASSIRHLFGDRGGSLSSVMWNFEQKGVIRISQEELKNQNDEELELALIEAGADDIIREEEGMTVYAKTENLSAVRSAIEAKKINIESADLEYVPKATQNVSEEDKEKIEKFIEALEDDEDVSDYYTNVNL